jgi:membrane associated rhomboid family serine protease
MTGKGHIGKVGDSPEDMSIYNRPYMRYNPSSSGGGPFSALKWILIVLVSIFLLQNILHHWFGSQLMVRWFSLGWGQLMEGKIWTLLSYGMIHSTHNALPWHMLLNGIFLYWFGREVQARMGSERFLEAFVFSVLIGGLVWLTSQWISGSAGLLVGASAGVFGVITLFCLFRWDHDMGLLFFPGTIQGKHLLYILLGFQAFFFLFGEIAPSRSLASTAYSAHLGGILGGFLYGRWLFARPTLTGWLRKFQPVTAQEPKWSRRAESGKTQGSGRFTVNITNRSKLKAEVDRILDKINEQGFGSLSDEEKRTLDRAKELL